MRKFVIEPSPCSGTGLSCIRAHDLDEHECRHVHNVVTNNYMPSDDYKLKIKSGAFLQGFMMPTGDLNNGWVMIEFWSRDEQAIRDFVKHVEDGLKVSDTAAL